MEQIYLGTAFDSFLATNYAVKVGNFIWGAKKAGRLVYQEMLAGEENVGGMTEQAMVNVDIWGTRRRCKQEPLFVDAFERATVTSTTWPIICQQLLSNYSLHNCN